MTDCGSKILRQGFPFFRFRKKVIKFLIYFKVFSGRNDTACLSNLPLFLVSIISIFTNFLATLKLLINKSETADTTDPEYVHSFDIGFHIFSRPSILLICTHRVHCMTFDGFDDLRLWADTLQDYLIC